MTLMNLMNDYNADVNHETYYYEMMYFDEYTQLSTIIDILRSISDDFDVDAEYFYISDRKYYSATEAEMRENIIDDLDEYAVDYIIDTLNIIELDEYDESLDSRMMCRDLAKTLMTMNYDELNAFLESERDIYFVDNIYYL